VAYCQAHIQFILVSKCGKLWLWIKTWLSIC